MPSLSRHFQSPAAGLYFIGNAAAGRFEPLMRFVCGCEFAARVVTRHVVSS
jgi:hypothetical protein